MASFESDDDDFLASPQKATIPSPKRSLKRLKKNAEKLLEAPKSLQSADPITMLELNSSTDPPLRSLRESSPSVDLECHPKPKVLPLADLPWKFCAQGGDDNPLAEVYSEAEPAKFPGELSEAEQEYLTGLDPNESQDKDELDHSDADDSSSLVSEEEVDEDDELAVLSLLEKSRSSSISSAPKMLSPKKPDASMHAEGEEKATRINKKIKAAELEEMHAASQRLLRETPIASFKFQMSMGKSITSVLEKIRLRKMQLLQGWKSSLYVHQSEDTSENIGQEPLPSENVLPHDENDVDIYDAGTQENKGQTMLQDNANQDDGSALASFPERLSAGDNTHASTHEKVDAGCESGDVRVQSTPLTGVFRAPMEDTQDLLSPYQSSQEDIIENIDTEDTHIFGGSRVSLHIDTQTQDDYEQWQDEEDNKENVEPSISDKLCTVPIAKGPSVRALIDDEAEDEDEEILVRAEEDEGDEGDDLRDLIVEETNEKEQDRDKREELHRKWLDQQDAVMTDDILLRLKTGWRAQDSRKRGLNFLDDEIELFEQKDKTLQDYDMEAEPREFQETPSDNSQDGEALREEARVFSFPEDVNDIHESDDDEAEHRMMRQRFLQESEEQGDLVSPADDETSREIFTLINKVNVASSNKKLKQGTVTDLRYLGGSTSNSNSSINSKSSFLRKSVSSTVGVIQRQGSNSGSGTRSFIFGRDDSNSSHSFDQHVDMREIKENIRPTSQGAMKETTHNKKFTEGKNTVKARKPTATRLGPSLFEILRRQSTDLDQSLQKESSPMLAAFKPIKPINTPRGISRA